MEINGWIIYTYTNLKFPVVSVVLKVVCLDGLLGGCGLGYKVGGLSWVKD